jgi:nitroreductase
MKRAAATARAESRPETIRSLLRVRQFREFTDQPPTDADLAAVADVARWSGSSRNSQPWRFITIRDVRGLRRIAEIGEPQTRGLRTAQAAIAIVMPGDEKRAVANAFDEARAAERMLIAAGLLGLGGGISWIRSDVVDQVRELLGIPADRIVRTIVAIGHPTEAARRPKSAPGQARLPRDQVVFEERWRESSER